MEGHFGKGYDRVIGRACGANCRLCACPVDFTAVDTEKPAEARDFVSGPALDACSTLNCSAGFVPVDGLLTEVRLVSHVASECRVMTEDCVFNDGPARAHGVEEGPR